MKKCKSEKSDKMKKAKSVKKVWKSDPPSKTPKCHLNGQNRHFVKSEPPGPAFFEFQGVPRDPVLRPKSTPLFLNVKNDRVFAFSSFAICAFWHFWSFFRFDKLTFSCFCRFLCNGLKALLLYTGRRMMMCGGFSPLLVDIYSPFVVFSWV